MLVEFKKLRIGDRFRVEDETHGPVDGTREGRLWERWTPEPGSSKGPVNARIADSFHPKLVEWFHGQVLVSVEGCSYCEQVDYIKALEWQINEFQPCSAAHSRIEGAIHMTYGTILGLDTCHHLCGTEWDINDEEKE